MSASPGRLAMPRRRGAFSGLLILLLGAWGALAPFVGPYFDWTLGPDTTWDFSTTRLVMQAAPGVAAVVGGLLLLTAANRGSAILGALLTITGGAWFVVGPTFSVLSAIPDIGAPLAPGTKGVAQSLSLFTGLGALLCVLGGMALARVSARLEGDADRLAGTAPAPAAEPRPHAPQRDRAIAPARREAAAPTRVAPADETPTRTTPAAHDAPTRTGGPADDDAPTRTSPADDDAPTRTSPTVGAPERADDADQTRVLGDDQPPPPDAADRRG